MAEECKIGFEYCPLPPNSSPEIVTTDWELASSILFIAFNWAEFILTVVFYGEIAFPQLNTVTTSDVMY